MFFSSVSRRRCSTMGEVAQTRPIDPAGTKHSSVLFIDTLAMAKRLESTGERIHCNNFKYWDRSLSKGPD